MRKIFVTITKLSAIVAIFAFLIARALNGSAFDRLNVASFNRVDLALGLFFNLAATTITIVRWRALVHALDMPLSMSNAMKFGFIGFMFNLSPIGIVGGDAVKIYLLSKHASAPIEKATASVILDRAIGLYAMFALGIVAAIASGLYADPSPTARLAWRGLVALTAISTICFAILMTSNGSQSRLVLWASKTRGIGKIVSKLTAATLAYRDRRRTLFYSFIATIFVHLGFAASLYFLAKGVFISAPSFIDHCALYCVGNVGSMIPLSAGPLEYFLDELYPLFPLVGGANGAEYFEKGAGMAIGVAFRLAAVIVALIGVVYYALARSDVKEARTETLSNSK